MSSPLADVRVLDIATFIAAPFCGTLLAEFGAEVVKVEQPGGGDSLRRFGTRTRCGDTYVWLSEARNKKSVTLDLRKAEGADIFRRMVARADVVLENFRPGTLEKWGLSYESLAAINPKLVMLSISGYGQTGPCRESPGFARIAHAFSGLAHLAGEPGRAPVVPGSTSLADYISGLFGAVGVLVALRHAERTGVGQRIDLALYESVFRLLDELAPRFAASGYQREPMGAETPTIVPHSHYLTSDEQWVAIACSTERMWQRLAKAMDRSELAQDPRYATMSARVERRAEVNELVSKWTRGLSLAAVLDRCRKEEVPCSKLLTISEIFAHPQFAARENLTTLEDERAGRLVVPAPVPRMSRTPPRLNHAGPALGQSNQRVFSDWLGLTEDAIAGLRERGVI